ncbi:MAG: transcription antitermination factor NusB [Anaerolineales bacterium]
MKGERRLARESALQALFEIDMTDHPVGEVLDERLREAEHLSARGREYSRSLVLGVLRYREILDAYIQSQASEWPLNQIALVDRNLLRMALYEFTAGDVPIKVAINEAVEIAKRFGSESAARFVNGVLGALVPKQEAILNEMEQQVQPQAEAEQTA